MSNYDDEELQALVKVIEALKELDEDALKRVLAYLLQRYKLTVL
jgi:hypothetical protein